MNNLILNKDTHTYLKDNKELVSISKIINNYYGESYENVPKDILKAAINRGNAVHKILELYFKNIYKDNIIKKLQELINKQETFTEIIKNYCNSALNWVQKYYKNKNQLIISEESLSFDFIAGTPDLLVKNDKLNLWFINDFKTYKTMTKELKQKAELQITAYYWLAKNNGYEMSNIHFIPLIKEYSVELIKIEITEAKIHEWEMAIALWKEKFYE